MDAKEVSFKPARMRTHPLEQMVRDTPEGHLEVPLHAAAERFWRERGYL
jgi:TRAP-type uncharacterized transport system substrate-binding protein